MRVFKAKNIISCHEKIFSPDDMTKGAGESKGGEVRGTEQLQQTFGVITDGVSYREGDENVELTFTQDDVMQIHHYHINGSTLLRIHTVCNGAPYKTPYSKFTERLMLHLVAIANRYNIPWKSFHHGDRCTCLCFEYINSRRIKTDFSDSLRRRVLKKQHGKTK